MRRLIFFISLLTCNSLFGEAANQNSKLPLFQPTKEDSLVTDQAVSDTSNTGREILADSGKSGGALKLNQKKVRGVRRKVHDNKEVSKISISRNLMQGVAAAQGDPLRVVSTLPGVANYNDMSVRPLIRGGESSETRVFFDGIPLIHPYHLGSIYSIFNIESLDKFDFYSGGFPANGHNALSGALFMYSRPSNLDSLQFFADLSWLRGNIYGSVPLIKNKLSIYFSLQSFWYDKVADGGIWLLDKMIDDPSLSQANNQYGNLLELPNFSDFQYGLHYKLNPKMNFTYNGIYAMDNFTAMEERWAFYVNNKEVPLNYYQWHLVHRTSNVNERDAGLTIDTLALVRIPNHVHVAGFDYNISDKTKITARAAYQGQKWNIGFHDEASWRDIRDSNENFVGYRYREESSLKYYHYKEMHSAKLSFSHSQNQNHSYQFGLDVDKLEENFNTKLPQPIYEIVINGNKDLLNSLGYYNQDELLIMYDSTVNNPYENYFDKLANIIRFDYRGRVTGYNTALYATHNWNIGLKSRFYSGLRAEWDGFANELFLSPRVSLYQSLSEKMELTLASGLYSQNDLPFYMRVTNPDLNSEKAVHLNGDIQYNISEALQIKWENYYKYYYDRIVTRLKSDLKINWDEVNNFFIDSTNFENTDLEIQDLYNLIYRNKSLVFDNKGIGQTFGHEISAFYKTSDFINGWLSWEYNYSVLKDHKQGRWYKSPNAKRWAINWVNYFHLPKFYKLSFRGKWASGYPYTPSTSFRDLMGETDDTISQRDTLLYVGQKSSAEYAPYMRMDVRLSKTGKLFGRPFEKYIGIWNMFNIPNFLLFDRRSRELKYFELNYPFPIVFLGINWRW